MALNKYDFTSVDGRKAFIQNEDTDIYVGVNDDGEIVTVKLEKGVGMTITTMQDNGWTRVDDYGVNGYKESEMFNGRWKQRDE